MDKKKLVYGGLGALAILIVYFSTRREKLKEVGEKVNKEAEFDHSILPSQLQPPYRLAEGENITPIGVKRSLNGISFKPRFDR